QQGEDAYFRRDAAQLAYGEEVKRVFQLLGVEEQQVRAERQIERFVEERQHRKLRFDVASGRFPNVVVSQELVHGRHAYGAELLDRRNGVPDELITIPP